MINKIEQISKEEFTAIFGENNLVYLNSSFNELNSDKCSKVIYLLFNQNEKKEMGIIFGLLENNVLSAPFSAPFTNIVTTKEKKSNDYYEFVKELISYVRNLNLAKSIKITLPPLIYDETAITYLQNALFSNRFTVQTLDINHYLILKEEEDYLVGLKSRERRTVKKTFKNRLQLNKATSHEEQKEAYDIIKKNRDAKGYPLRMSFKQIQNTIELIDADFFIVKDELENNVAAALVYNLSNSISQVIYWGDLPGNEEKSPMNFLAYALLKYYYQLGVKILDIGPSSENSNPNFGLSDFKQSLGCECTTKLSFSIKLS